MPIPVIIMLSILGLLLYAAIGGVVGMTLVGLSFKGKDNMDDRFTRQAAGIYVDGYSTDPSYHVVAAVFWPLLIPAVALIYLPYKVCRYAMELTARNVVYRGES